METTGQPMKIHISMETKLLLDTLGRFFTEHRGLVDVKGKVAHAQTIGTFLNCCRENWTHIGSLGRRGVWVSNLKESFQKWPHLGHSPKSWDIRSVILSLK